ncbi:hypothetical protein V5799_002969 [Amblyomma americanum]|uniref:TIR domain-containing protein n=1 Tax=Amblyomma americanum TaxID=6943 RepID=A0AAQ4DAB0_AMBAM
MQTLPRGLRAAQGLKNLFVNWSKIKILKGGPYLPRLTRLDLRFNGIEEVDDQFLSRFPRLLHLQLSSNKIESLSPNLFKRTRLFKAVILGNNRISTVGDFFDNMLKLRRLVLGRNKITDIKALVKSTMPNLSHLDLERNSIGVITQFSASNRKIEVILLNNNNITDVEPGAFRALQKLIHLDLSRNNITFLNASIFPTDSRLEYINLSENRLCSATGTFKNTRRIKILNLSSDRITSITDVVAGLRSLKKLSLVENRLTNIPDNTFIDNSGLLEIDIAENSIQWVGRNAFRGLVTLTSLRLRSNQLLSLNASVGNLPNIKHIDASLNCIQALEMSEFGHNRVLGSILLTGNNISRVEGAFTGAERLRSLGLAGNRVETLRRSDFPRRMTAELNIALQHNPLFCDCRMAWLLSADSEARIAWYPTCEHPSWLKGKVLSKISMKNLILWPEGCSPGCHCECREKPGGEREIIVNCSLAALSRLPRNFPVGTTQLDMRDNRLEHLDDILKQSAPQVKLLCLRNNRLSSVNLTFLPETVHSLDLSGNRLTKLPHNLARERQLTSLWLSGNPFHCDCTDYPFRQWIGAHPDVIRDIGSLICTESPNSVVSRKTFLALGQTHLCPASFPQYVAYLIYALVVLTLFLAISAAYLNFKQPLKAWLRTLGFFGWLRCVAEDDMDHEKLFDVFVSFSSKDAALVHDQLLPTIEGLGLSYCTYDRNFKGGFLLQDIIRDAVSCSRRTLLLLTRNFMASEWCRLEFRLAHQRALEDSINRLVIVMVDEVDPGALDEDLRLYVRAANYLCWGEPNFWERLQRSLPKTHARRKLILHDSTQQNANDIGRVEL